MKGVVEAASNCMSEFFFFKQKTAYEIKECDWSSDVCSSDLYISLPIADNCLCYPLADNFL